jgi:hypothetical protein
MRQAVVIIHGIGDQRPMTTLREFVKGVVEHSKKGGNSSDQKGGNSSDQTDAFSFYSKPDRISDTLELRRITAIRELSDGKTQFEGNSTDFYELYWQHLMTGTTLAHTQAWLKMLLWRNPKNVPQRLRPLWLLAWALVLAAVAVSIYSAKNSLISSGQPLIAGGIFAVLLPLLLRFLVVPLLQLFATKWIGDAARYLSPFPENVGIRHAIRSAGLDLLRGLHLDPLQRYERIVVVGHSLGSVIAYDILTYLWQEMHSKVERISQSNGKPELVELDYKNEPPPLRISQPVLDALLEMSEKIFDKSKQSELNHQYRELQNKLLQEYSNQYKNEEPGARFPWRITDLITLGSPLTYAEFLLADDLTSFTEKKQQREFPTCPPQLEDPRDDKDCLGDGGLLKRVLGTGDQKRGIHILHHAALFACTRWTNLYFPGDIIAGPLACKFGWGVHDVPLSGRSAKNWTSHVKYWAKKEGLALDELIKALRLG